MAIFRQIELYLDAGYSRFEQKSFIFKSRCACNYLERWLKDRGFETSLSRVNIHCSTDQSQVRVRALKEGGILEVCIRYDLPPLESLSDQALQRHIRHIIDLGLCSAANFMVVPREDCMGILLRFENEGFKNEWVHTRKSWKRWSVQCEIVAKLTTEKFSLSQHIYRDGKLVVAKEIVETLPREMLFYGYLGVLSVDALGRIFYKKGGEVLTEFDLNINEFTKLIGSPIP